MKPRDICKKLTVTSNNGLSLATCSHMVETEDQEQPLFKLQRKMWEDLYGELYRSVLAIKQILPHEYNVKQLEELLKPPL